MLYLRQFFWLIFSPLNRPETRRREHVTTSFFIVFEISGGCFQKETKRILLPKAGGLEIDTTGRCHLVTNLFPKSIFEFLGQTGVAAFAAMRDPREPCLFWCGGRLVSGGTPAFSKQQVVLGGCSRCLCSLKSGTSGRFEVKIPGSHRWSRLRIHTEPTLCNHVRLIPTSLCGMHVVKTTQQPRPIVLFYGMSPCM